MKKILTAAAALSVAASSAFANSDYPVELTKDGILYNCAADVNTIDGVKTRSCIEVGGASEAGGGLFATGLGGVGLVAGLGAVIFVGIVATNDDNDTTVSTQ